MNMRLSIICGMALRDYWHERALSLCAVLALATVLAPLLILFGVRNGVISNLQERLLQDPRNLEIVPVGSGKYGKDFFEELRKRPDVGYVVPQTRAIAATIGLLPASEKKGGLPPNPVAERYTYSRYSTHKKTAMINKYLYAISNTCRV